MPKKTFTIILILLVVILAVGGIFLYVTGKRAPAPEEETVPREFAPFGRAPEEEMRISEIVEIEEREEILEAPEPQVIAPSKLKQITTFAVAGILPFVKERQIEKDEPETTLETYDFTEYKTMRLGSSGLEVENLQIVLNRQDPSPGLEVNGEFDDATKDAVILFQKENTLGADGIAGRRTFAALNKFQGISAPETEMVAAVRYVKKSSSHILETFLDEIDEIKISITTIPAIHSALLGSVGESVILRYFDDNKRTIETFSGVLAEEEPPRELLGEFLLQNITDISISPDREKVFYLREVDDEAIGVTASFDGSNKKQIFNSPFTEWLSQWVGERTIMLQTKASAVASGFLFH